MRSLLAAYQKFLTSLIDKGKRAEQIRAGKKWDSIVEELRNRKFNNAK